MAPVSVSVIVAWPVGTPMPGAIAATAMVNKTVWPDVEVALVLVKLVAVEACSTVCVAVAPSVLAL